MLCLQLQKRYLEQRIESNKSFVFPLRDYSYRHTICQDYWYFVELTKLFLSVCIHNDHAHDAPIHSPCLAHDQVPARTLPLRRAFAVIYGYGGGFVSLDASLPN